MYQREYPKYQANDENSIHGYSKSSHHNGSGMNSNNVMIYEERGDNINKTPNRFYYNADNKISQATTPVHREQPPMQPVKQNAYSSAAVSGTSSVTATTAGTTTLSDVKNRLLMMQKNKEELEEKLRRINRMPQY
jgi:hypothetical protein